MLCWIAKIFFFEVHIKQPAYENNKNLVTNIKPTLIYILHNPLKYTFFC